MVPLNLTSIVDRACSDIGSLVLSLLHTRGGCSHLCSRTFSLYQCNLTLFQTAQDYLFLVVPRVTLQAFRRLALFVLLPRNFINPCAIVELRLGTGVKKILKNQIGVH